MKILITGSGGQVGFELMRAQWPAGTELVGLARAELDITSRQAIAGELTRIAPDVVLNAAAYTAVDAAESDRAGAFAVNCDGPAWLAGACAARAVPLVHLSTDYVFDGASPVPNLETDPVGPIGVYGASKAAGEAAVRAAQPRHVIVRTAWVYGVHGHNFVKTMLRLGHERELVRVVADQHGTPTAAADIASLLVVVAERVARSASGGAPPWGTYHFTAAGATTWHGLAEHVFRHQQRVSGRRPRLEAIATSEYPTPARRPANSRLDCSRLEATFGVARHPWQVSLDRVLDELLPAATGPG